MLVMLLKSDVAWGAGVSVRCPVDWGRLEVASDFIGLRNTPAIVFRRIARDPKKRCWSQNSYLGAMRSPVLKVWSHDGRFAHVTCIRGL